MTLDQDSVAGSLDSSSGITGDVYRYDAFISYATIPDYSLARRLYSILESFHRTVPPNSLPPGVRLRPLKICVDGSAFSVRGCRARDFAPVVPQFGNADDGDGMRLIAAHLAASRYLIVAYPGKMTAWMSRELEWWLTNRRTDQVLLAVTYGDVDSDQSFFDGQLIAAGLSKRLWYDLRAHHTKKCRAWSKVRDFEDACVRLAADLNHLRPADIWPLWVREQHKRSRSKMRAIASAALVMFLLALFALIQWRFAVTERKNAERRLIGLYEEQGRTEWLDGDSRRAAPYLANAYKISIGPTLGERPPSATAFLLARAIGSLGIESRSFGSESEPLTSPCFSANGRYLASGTRNETKLWDTRTGAIISTQSHSSPIQDLSISTDSARLLTVSGATAYIWNVDDGQLIKTLVGHNYDVKSASFSPDGLRVVTASIDNTACVWNSTTGTAIATCRGHTATVRWATFSDDGRLIVTVSSDDTVRVWNAMTGTETCSLHDLVGTISYATFSPDATRVLTFGTPDLAIHHAVTGKKLSSLSSRFGWTSAVFTPDGRRCYAANINVNDVVIWEVMSQHKLILHGHSNFVSHVRFNRTASQVITSSMDNTARVWDVEGGRLLATLEGTQNLFGITWAGFSPNGLQALTIEGSTTGRLWDLSRGMLKKSFGDTGTRPLSLRFSPDGGKLAVAYDDGTVRLWNAGTGTRILLISALQDAGLLGASYSPNGTLLLTSGSNEVHIRRVDTGASLLTLHGNTMHIPQPFSDDGKHVLIVQASEGGSVGKETVGLYDIESGALLEKYITAGRVLYADLDPVGRIGLIAYSPIPSSTTDSATSELVICDVAADKELMVCSPVRKGITTVALTHDASRVAIGDFDGPIAIWEIGSKRPVASIEGHGGFTSPRSIAFSHNGALLLTTAITVASDGDARIWDSETGRLLAALPMHGRHIADATFDPTEQRLATVSSDGVIEIWDVHIENRHPATIEAELSSHNIWRLVNGRLLPPDQNR